MTLSSPRLIIAIGILLLLVPALGAWAGGPTQGHRDIFGPGFGHTPKTPPRTEHRPPWRGQHAVDRLRYWNEVAIDASGLDHTPVGPDEDRVFGEQIGPGRSSRAMAIVHIAMFDAVNAIVGGYQDYSGIPRAHGAASLNAAIAQAAHDTLAALFPSQAATFAAMLAEDLAAIPHHRQRSRGIEIGRQAAAAILARRADDGSNHAEPRIGIDYLTSDAPGRWRQDPISMSPVALGAYWGQVTPFTLESGAQFRSPPPPPLDSPAYTAAYHEALAIGGDGITTGTIRTEEQTFIGNFWAYDGTPSLCAPPRLYNQVTMQIVDQLGYPSDVIELARLLALVNVAMADTAIAAWESKYFYDLWRPVIAIRESDLGTGPSGLGDGNPDTVGDPAFTPLGAPASNLTGPNFTPPFPAYPGGHAAFGGALFETLRQYYRTDDIAFTFVSDEYNGITVDNAGNVRPLKPRSFPSLSAAEQENGDSRVYLGIHWGFDNVEGINQGRQVANHVFAQAFMPTRKSRGRH